jgi:hypothetical protein
VARGDVMQQARAGPKIPSLHRRDPSGMVYAEALPAYALAASNRNVVSSTALITLEAAALLTLGYEPAQVAVKVVPRSRAGTN